MQAGVFFPSFKEDGCVIEEQEDHLVLAVRIPKTTINANMALLAVLADLAGASLGRRADVSAPVAPTVKDRLKPWRAKALLGAGMLILGMVGLPQLMPTSGFASGSPPVQYRNWQMLKPVFKVGEAIEIDMQYRLDRHCAASFDRSIRRIDDDSTAYSSRDFGGGAGKVSTEFVDHRYVIHNVILTPGEYYYSGSTHSECSDGGYVIPHQQLTFRVE